MFLQGKDYKEVHNNNIIEFHKIIFSLCRKKKKLKFD